MLDYNQITPGEHIVFNSEPYEVLDSQILRKQQRKPVNQTKIRNLKTGKVTERTFHQSERVQKAEMEIKDIVYIFSKNNEIWFHSVGDKSNRFAINEDIIGDRNRFLREGTEIQAVVFNDEIIGVKISIKMELKVKDAPPAVRGNTAQGATKTVTLETGAEISVPLFINEGDIVRVNTETGQYTERVEKK